MSKRDEVLEAIRQHLSGRGIEAERVKPDAHLAADLDLDSLDTVELTLGLEQHFNIEIPDSDLENVALVSDAIDVIAPKLGASA